MLVLGTTSVRLAGHAAALQLHGRAEGGEAFLEDGSSMPQRRTFLTPGKTVSYLRPKACF